MSMALFCCPKPDDDLKYKEQEESIWAMPTIMIVHLRHLSRTLENTTRVCLLVGEWVKFPTTAEELQKVFERIGIGSKDDFGHPYEEWFITDYRIMNDAT